MDNSHFSEQLKGFMDRAATHIGARWSDDRTMLEWPSEEEGGKPYRLGASDNLVDVTQAHRWLSMTLSEDGPVGRILYSENRYGDPNAETELIAPDLPSEPADPESFLAPPNDAKHRKAVQDKLHSDWDEEDRQQELHKKLSEGIWSKREPITAEKVKSKVNSWVETLREFNDTRDVGSMNTRPEIPFGMVKYFNSNTMGLDESGVKLQFNRKTGNYDPT